MKKIDKKLIGPRLRRFFFGMKFSDGFIYKFTIYILLISFSYIYLYPILYMFVNSFKTVDDLINPGVKWIPTTLDFENYARAFQALGFPGSIFETTWYVLKVSVAATVSAAVIGYGFARFNFPLKKLLFGIMLATFILPSQVTMVANMLIFRNLNIMSTQWTMLLPAISGQGINAAIFILIFYQFYKTIPTILMESAEIDGASQFKIFRSIALPLAIPSFIIVFLFSFVWYWNESFITALYVGGQITLPLKLQVFRASYEALFPPGTPGAELNEAIMLAGNMVTIFPLMLLYFFAQRNFTQSIDRTGITGE
ncbi:MAG: carbohydrate ABC transporter permease [Firmicutes bacterium]|nr:carbohydrate ABC transporter permease [Bacillota bacterium]